MEQVSVLFLLLELSVLVCLYVSLRYSYSGCCIEVCSHVAFMWLPDFENQTNERYVVLNDA